MKKKTQDKQSEGFYVRLIPKDAELFRRMVKAKRPKISISEYIRRAIFQDLHPF